MSTAVETDRRGYFPVSTPPEKKLTPPYTSPILDPGEGAWWTGENWDNRWPVYRRIVEEYSYEPELDKHGDPIEIRNPRTGDFLRRKMRRITQQFEREFIVLPVDPPNAKYPNNMGVRNFLFREDPEQLKRMERKRKIEQFTGEFVEKLVDSGRTVDDLFDALEAAPDDEVDEYPIWKGPWVTFSDGSRRGGPHDPVTKEMAAEIQQRIYAEE